MAYEIRAIVGDKKLRETLIALKPLSLEPPVVIPADFDDGDRGPEQMPKAAAQPQRPKVKYKKSEVQHGGKHLKGMGSTQVVRDLITRSGVTHISAKEMKRATIAAGYSAGAYSHAIKLLMKDKSIRRIDDQGNYEVVRPAQEPRGLAEYEAAQHG